MPPRTLRGVGVSPGLAVAPALVIETRFPEVADRSISADEVEPEIRRLHFAMDAVVDSLAALRERVRARAGEEESRIFDAQILMVQDPDFQASVEHLIRQNLLSAETAFEFKALELRVAWSGSASLRMRERLADLAAIQMRVLRHLVGGEAEDAWVTQTHENVIIVAHELSPGMTVQMDRDHVLGIISEEGTRTSHAAILAHSLGIPAVMGAAGAMARIQSGQVVLLDGRTGAVIIDPEAVDLEEARVRATRRHRLELELETLGDAPATTPDGEVVTLLGNVDLPEEIEVAARHGARGVGLLRTEFLITGRASLPSEDEQAAYFQRVARAFPRQPVVIRTFDLGGDKFPAAFEAPQEANPFLGWRSIRVCLDQPDIFRPQLRAILRSALNHDLRVMLPLVTRVDEVEQTREILAQEADALMRAGVPAATEVPVGVMIETPAAVLMADRLAEVSDFFSVGTNDLTQYTLAVDRGNARLAGRFTPHDPSVIRQLRQVIQAGEAASVPVGICGEMASDPLMAVLLIGLGYRQLSVAPPTLLLLRWLVRQVPLSACQEAAAAALGASRAEAVRAALRAIVTSHIDLRLLDPE
ncbi:MAG: phosphoenolpyruvate--protein phosphotransferase [Gemmatimonadota bacterium]|nr:phosphoenolpyruvate--protein phosphotransferase [Gemmatimonadota bacterium]